MVRKRVNVRRTMVMEVLGEREGLVRFGVGRGGF